MKQVIRNFKNRLRRVPIAGTIIGKVYVKLLSRRFLGSEAYWVNRYERGGNSGFGSQNKLAEFKADILNAFVDEHNVRSVIEYGCGDGRQLKLAKYPTYLGFDISNVALKQCKELFHDDRTKSFKLMYEYTGECAELAISLDVVYHLVEGEVFESYMKRLFNSATRFVIVYSSNRNEQDKMRFPHIRHREFTKWVDDNIHNWKLIRHLKNKYPYIDETGEGSFAEFFIYKKA